MLIVYTHIYYIVVHISYTYNILYMYYIYMIYSYIYAFARALQAQIRQKSHVDKMDMDCTYFWQNKTKTGGSTVWLALGCFLQKIENNNESKQREERERERETKETCQTQTNSQQPEQVRSRANQSIRRFELPWFCTAGDSRCWDRC